MMKKLKLTEEKKKWLMSGKNRILKGEQLNYNASQQAKYRTAILKLVRVMTKGTKNEVRRLFESKIAEEFQEQQERAATLDESLTSKAKKVMDVLLEKFTKLFDLKALELSKNMVEGAEKTSSSSLKSSLKKLSGSLSLNTNVTPAGMEDITKAMIEENVSLIKSIPQEYLKNVSGAVMRNVTTGGSVEDITKAITRFNGITERRATNIALDQTRKAYNNINKQKMQSLGVKKFRWLHTGSGQHPRKSHIALNRGIFSFDNLPVINKEQVDKGYEAPITGIPGQAINCRCLMEPIIEFEDGEEI